MFKCIARELVAANAASKLSFKADFSAPAVSDKIIPIAINAPVDCPRYIARIVENINIQVPTPDWMQEYLRRAGIRRINCIVDITNYVMLELGQPMHAFDAAQIKDGICVRRAKVDEQLILLDERTVTLSPDILVISDSEKPLAMAGIMGGIHSGISDTTKAIILESAFFNPLSIAGKARAYGITTDSSQRFERGVDPQVARLAIERATLLIQQIAGGVPGPVLEQIYTEYLPAQPDILLRRQRIEHVLGVSLPAATVEQILTRLTMHWQQHELGWLVKAPSYRFDILLEEDLIEELARLVGYDYIPTHAPLARLAMPKQSETTLPLARFSTLLVDLGYQEVITYSFVDPKFQALLAPSQAPFTLINPIASDMAAMRTTLWVGLLQTVIYNQNRQQTRMKIFETGLRYVMEPHGELVQQQMLAGVMMGLSFPEQWAQPLRAIDFYDLKSDVEALLTLTGRQQAFTFSDIKSLSAAEGFALAALHPGQAAAIYKTDGKTPELVGLLGSLHPGLLQPLSIKEPVFVFELYADKLSQAVLPQSKPLSRFPAIRRDLAVVVDEALPVALLSGIVKEQLGDLLQFVQYFDIYRGAGIEPGKKSVALAMILQHPTRTLIDDEINDLIQQVIKALAAKCQATIRS